MQLDIIQLCGRHSRPRPQILESSTGAVDKFFTTNTDHATPAKRHNHGCGARNLTQTLRSRRIPPCEIHLRANVLTRHTGLPTINPIDVYTKLARPTIHPQCAWKEEHAEHF